MAKVQIPKGVFDIVPEASDSDSLWKASHLWHWLESTIREVSSAYGFEEIRTPLFERTELFQRGVGETSDIVSKEMYTFLDKGKRSMTLRPEGTAAALRAFIENQMQEKRAIQKLFYIAPMFRYERPQAGRYRQHHQFGVEAIGSRLPAQDVEVIDLLCTLLRRLGLNDVVVTLNSLGDSESRLAYRNALQDFLRPHLEQLSEDSRRRFEANPLRILDSKAAEDKVICAQCPSILDYLSDGARDHFEEVKKLLQLLSIPFQVDSRLVRGLDYYNGTVFEVISPQLGAQNSVAGGGRYDGLMGTLGGPDLPACGFGCGLERLLQTLLKVSDQCPSRPGPLAMFIPLGEAAAEASMQVVHTLRSEGLPVAMDLTGKKLKHAMRYANSTGARYVIVVGSDELSEGVIDIKEMDSGKIVQQAAWSEVCTILRQLWMPNS